MVKIKKSFLSVTNVLTCWQSTESVLFLFTLLITVKALRQTEGSFECFLVCFTRYGYFGLLATLEELLLCYRWFW